jgi:hypothetical protein
MRWRKQAHQHPDSEGDEEKTDSPRHWCCQSQPKAHEQETVFPLLIKRQQSVHGHGIQDVVRPSLEQVNPKSLPLL